MEHLVSDFLQVGSNMVGVIGAITGKGRLALAIKVCRPAWSDAICRRAATELAAGIRPAGEYASRHEWPAALESPLTRFAKHHLGAVEAKVADELALPRWDQHWNQVRDEAFSRHAPNETPQSSPLRRVA